ncbi:MAG: hypothetical protein IPI63_05035 [Methanothrix sp.]|nr:hypothetical protein [Methanothrix sp.]MBK7386105.1 hypothetical protein [Methanothrix sp.]HPW74153.1 hypothetical protein [Methanothrix sp.]
MGRPMQADGGSGAPNRHGWMKSGGSELPLTNFGEQKPDSFSFTSKTG